MIPAAPLRALFYVQHLLGLGHLMRASRIAVALQQNGFHVLLVTGGVIEEGYKLPGVEHVALPSIAVRGSDFSVLVDQHDKPIDEPFRQVRAQQLLDVYARHTPDVVIIEAYPFGRRQMQFELLPLIDAVESSQPRPALVCSVRDVVQRRTKPGRDAQTAAIIKQHFDKVLVHGDPEVAALAESFSEAGTIADQIVYTGLVSAAQPSGDSPHYDVVVSAGGGAVGYRLLHDALVAAALLPAAYTWCVITGPNLPETQFEELLGNTPVNVTLERFRDDFIGLLSAASLSVSQAGYNTVNDVMQAGCRTILVPYSEQGETEQSDRARRLSSLGRAHVIEEDALSGSVLAAAITDVMAQAAPAALLSSMNGAENTAVILRDLVSSGHTAT